MAVGSVQFAILVVIEITEVSKSIRIGVELVGVADGGTIVDLFLNAIEVTVKCAVSRAGERGFFGRCDADSVSATDEAICWARITGFRVPADRISAEATVDWTFCC